MQTALARSRQPQTTLSLVQKSSNAQLALSQPTAPADGLRFAKQLVGQWPHLKADQPDVFVASIGAVLAQYPLGLVKECCDPRTGAARKVEFLTIRALVTWLDERQTALRQLAEYRPPSRLALPAKSYSAEHCQTMMGMFRDLLASLRTRKEDPIDRMRREAREAAQSRLAGDKARALAELQPDVRK